MFNKGTKLLYTSPYKYKDFKVKDQLCIFESEYVPGRCVVFFKKGTEFTLKRHIAYKYLRLADVL